MPARSRSTPWAATRRPGEIVAGAAPGGRRARRPRRPRRPARGARRRRRPRGPRRVRGHRDGRRPRARSVRRKKDSSLVRAAEAVRDGEASAMVSAGNTGATMGSALLRMGRIKGVARPAIATPIPVPGGDRPRSCSTPAPTPSASPSGSCSSPRWARSSPASATASPTPRSACCRSARRRRKGTPLVKETHALLAERRVDGRRGRLRRQRRGPRPHDRRRRRGRHRRLHRQRRPQDPRGRACGRSSAPCSGRSAPPTRPRRPPTCCCRRLLPLDDQLDPDTTGGAMLLGVDGVCIISHGSSSATRDRQRRPGGRGDGRRPTWSGHLGRGRRPDRPDGPQPEPFTSEQARRQVAPSRLDPARPGAARARRDPRRAGPDGPPGGLRAHPGPPGRHPRDRARRRSPRATRSPTTSTPTPWP